MYSSLSSTIPVHAVNTRASTRAQWTPLPTYVRPANTRARRYTRGTTCARGEHPCMQQKAQHIRETHNAHQRHSPEARYWRRQKGMYNFFEFKEGYKHAWRSVELSTLTFGLQKFSC